MVTKRFIYNEKGDKKRAAFNHWKNVMKQKYDISVEEYERLLMAQNSRCAICDTPAGKKRLSVDHNHDTKKVRGLLCSTCNSGLGMVKENKYILENMIRYLEKYEETR